MGQPKLNSAKPNEYNKETILFHQNFISYLEVGGAYVSL